MSFQEDNDEPQVVQTAFSVKLTGYDEKQKIALIKEIKTILPDCNLVQVTILPCIMCTTKSYQVH